MKKYTWESIEEMNDENDNPTCWGTEINHKEYGKFLWISIYPNNKYHIEVEIGDEIVVLKECKTLQSAKRWVTTNI